MICLNRPHRPTQLFYITTYIFNERKTIDDKASIARSLFYCNPLFVTKLGETIASSGKSNAIDISCSTFEAF